MKKSKNLTLFFTVACLCFFCTGCFTDTPYISYKDTVSHLEIENLLGTWHELAQMGRPENEQIAKVTINSHINEKGLIRMTADLRKYTLFGPLNTKKGTIKWDENHPGVIKYSFFLNFYTDYFILYLADDYSVFLACNNKATRLWLLSRDHNVQKKYLDLMYSKITSLGFDPSNLVWNESYF
ncbi:MAG: hypothetical protein GX877_02230 [Bacteroidales bacterium]|nr:hypothetical protein [Bacteroidales bacterium]